MIQPFRRILHLIKSQMSLFDHQPTHQEIRHREGTTRHTSSGAVIQIAPTVAKVTVRGKEGPHLAHGELIRYKLPGQPRKQKGTVIGGDHASGYQIQPARTGTVFKPQPITTDRDSVWTKEEFDAENAPTGIREATSRGGSTISVAESNRRAEVGRQRTGMDAGEVMSHPDFLRQMKDTLAGIAGTNNMNPSYATTGGVLLNDDQDSNDLYSEYVAAAMNSFRTETSKAPQEDLDDLRNNLAGTVEHSRILMSMHRAGETAAIRQAKARKQYLQDAESYDGTMEDDQESGMRAIAAKAATVPEHESTAAQKGQLAQGIIDHLDALDDSVAAAIIKMKFGFGRFDKPDEDGEKGSKDSTIAAALNRANMPPPSGDKWTAAMVAARMTSALASLGRTKGVQELRGFLKSLREYNDLRKAVTPYPAVFDLMDRFHLIKSHIRQYARQDGTLVTEHSNKVLKKHPDITAHENAHGEQVHAGARLSHGTELAGHLKSQGWKEKEAHPVTRDEDAKKGKKEDLPEPSKIKGANQENQALVSAQRTIDKMHQAVKDSDDPVAALTAINTSRGNPYLKAVDDERERLLAHFGHKVDRDQVATKYEKDGHTVILSDGKVHFAGGDPDKAKDAVTSLAGKKQVASADSGKKQPTFIAGEGKNATNSAYTAKLNPVQSTYHLVEAHDLTTSHTMQGHVNRAYPQEIQPRERERLSSQMQMANIMNDIKPELFGHSATASDGAPIVGKDGAVESGNGRTIALTEAYKRGLADKYKAWLSEHADQFGLKPEDVDGMAAPMLVRVRGDEDTNKDRAEFAREANQSSNLGSSPAEQAWSDSERIDDALLKKFSPDEDGEIYNEDNMDFIQGFLEKLGKNEAASLRDADGDPNKKAIERIQNAVFTKVYGSSVLTELQAESAKPRIRNILRALNSCVGDFAAVKGHDDLDVIPDIMEAIEYTLSHQGQSKAELEHTLKNAGALNFTGDTPTFKTDHSVNMILAIADRSGSRSRIENVLKAISNAIKTEVADRENPEVDMFSGPAVPKSKEAVVKQALDSVVNKSLKAGAFLLRKSHVKEYVKADGTMVQAHEDKRLAHVAAHPQHQTETAEFKEWFGGSKVVDREGNPLVVYHGTKEGGFDIFDHGKKGSNTFHRSDEVWFHFTTDKLDAGVYAGGRRRAEYPRSEIKELYLKLVNPLVVTHSALSPRHIKEALDGGHDGVIAPAGTGTNKEIVVFSPEQIKSATSNSGRFSAKEASINKSFCTTVFTHLLRKSTGGSNGRNKRRGEVPAQGGNAEESAGGSRRNGQEGQGDGELRKSREEAGESGGHGKAAGEGQGGSGAGRAGAVRPFIYLLRKSQMSLFDWTPPKHEEARTVHTSERHLASGAVVVVQEHRRKTQVAAKPEPTGTSLKHSDENYRYKDVGHVPGSRKELAAAQASMIKGRAKAGTGVTFQEVDFDALEENPREAYDLITKDAIAKEVDWEAVKAGGVEPGAGFLMYKLYAAVAPKPEDSPQARKDFVFGINALQDRFADSKTPDAVIAKIREIQEEMTGFTMNPEQQKEWERLTLASSIPATEYRRLRKEHDAIWNDYYGPSGRLQSLKWDQKKRLDRKWKADPELQERIDALQKDVDAAEKVDRQWRTDHQPAMDAADKASSAAYREQRAFKENVIKTNILSHPLTRGWNSFGKKFFNAINFNSYKGSDAFGTHIATARSGKITDWNWLEKDTKPRAASKTSVQFQLKVAENVERIGGAPLPKKDYGTDDIKQEFNLANVQSGNWVLKDLNAAKHHTEQCALALQDMAEMLGIPNAEVSMNGRLSLAFGARGSGGVFGAGAAAHYEPKYRVINLTKMKGGGSLGHEWLHALSDITGEVESGERAGTGNAATGLPPTTPVLKAFSDLVFEMRDGNHNEMVKTKISITEAEKDHWLKRVDRARQTKFYGARTIQGIVEAKDLTEAVKGVFDKMNRGEFGAVGGHKAKKQYELYRQMATAVHAGTEGSYHTMGFKSGSSFYVEAQKIDAEGKGSYWQDREEMAARAFAAYISDKLHEKGRENTYLASYADNKYYIIEGIKPYPEGEERKRINAAFDRLFDAIKVNGTLKKAMGMQTKSYRAGGIYLLRKSQIAFDFSPKHQEERTVHAGVRHLQSGATVQVAEHQREIQVGDRVTLSRVRQDAFKGKHGHVLKHIKSRSAVRIALDDGSTYEAHKDNVDLVEAVSDSASKQRVDEAQEKKAALAQKKAAKQALLDAELTAAQKEAEKKDQKLSKILDIMPDVPKEALPLIDAAVTKERRNMAKAWVVVSYHTTVKRPTTVSFSSEASAQAWLDRQDKAKTLFGIFPPKGAGQPLAKSTRHLPLLKSKTSLDGRIDFNGLKISVETGRSRVREWYNPQDGTQGMSLMRHPYGYVCGSMGVDGDQYDVICGPDRTALNAFIVTTMAAPDFTEVDEQKAIIGIATAEEARKVFDACYNDPRFFGSLAVLPFEEFKSQVLTTKDSPRLLGGELLQKSGEAACKLLGDSMNVDWKKYDLDEFCDGMFAEKEHADAVDGNQKTVAKIVLDHLDEDPKYYSNMQAAKDAGIMKES